MMCWPRALPPGVQCPRPCRPGWPPASQLPLQGLHFTHSSSNIAQQRSTHTAPSRLALMVQGDHPAPAVAALQAAGDDADALTEAIQAASWLDAVPGEDRQKLRAARTRLRKLQHAAAADAAAAEANKERSPHAKPVYDGAEFDELVDKYQGLKWRMISKPGGATVKPDDFYRLYALHMQATQGDNTGERPMWAERGGLDFEGRARWDAWSAVKGLDADKAKLRFVKLYYEFLPSCLYGDDRGGVSA